MVSINNKSGDGVGNLLGGNGAIAGVIREQVAETGNRYGGFNQQTSIQLANAFGAISAGAYGNLTNQSDEQNADNMWTGSRIATNAAANNYLMPQEKSNLVKELQSCGNDQTCRNQVQIKYEVISNPRDEEFNKLYDACKGGNQQSCSDFKAIHYDLRQKLTEEGNQYYASLTDKERQDQFKALPAEDSVFHTFQRDPQSGSIINILNGREQGITKYVHPIFGYEIVLDTNKNIITDPLNIGTYNFYNPNLGVGNELLEGFINHKDFDIDPYYLYGNAPSISDPTSFEQRILRSGNRYLNFNLGK